ncbi:hypothetical protein DCAR_0312604 [Daucus carota subsp. sativus]|uniref:Uncharacterized protein n=1 Tax=Daucus carota subsp. sativus TaxID=79200 RepID=A0A166B5H0_DAUCS|nr:hypothetical protein DCAR_0312604 [Daucus carota subsp. sativus]
MLQLDGSATSDKILVTETKRSPFSCSLFTISYWHCLTGEKSSPMSLSFWFEIVNGLDLGLISSELLHYNHGKYIAKVSTTLPR